MRSLIHTSKAKYTLFATVIIIISLRGLHHTLENIAYPGFIYHLMSVSHQFRNPCTHILKGPLTATATVTPLYIGTKRNCIYIIAKCLR